MTRNDGQKAIRRIAAGPSENVFLSQHGKVRAPSRGKRPLTKQKMMEVLRHGWIVEGPTADNATADGWKVSVHRNADGHRQEVVGVLRPTSRDRGGHGMT